MLKFRGVYLLFLILLILVILLNEFYSNSFKMGAFFNTDALYVPQLVRDLHDNIFNIQSWNLSKAPSYIDILLFYIINSFFDGFNSIVTFFSLQILLTIYVVYKVYLRKNDSLGTYFLTSISILTLAYLLINQIYPYFIILKIAHHYSEFLVWLVTSIAMLVYLKTYKNNIATMIVLISFVQCLSDQLYYIHFIVPSIIYLFFYVFIVNTPHKLKIFKLIFSIGMVSIIAYLLNLYFFRENVLNIKSSFTIQSLMVDILRFFNLVIGINKKYWLIMTINIIFYCYCLYSIIKKDKNVAWTSFFILSFVFSVLTILVSPSANSIGRYFLPFLYVPILFIAYTLPNIKILKYEQIQLVLIILLCSILVFSVSFKKWIFQYYPDHISCVDINLSERGIKNVVGGFWVARHYTYLSHEKINVSPFYNNFKRDLRVMNRSKFAKEYSGFLVNSNDNKGFKSNSVIDTFGKPREKINCDKITILIYNKDSIFLNKSLSLTIE